ncbi:hypothetical protein [Pseudomonas umsongensis]|uniref:hypothetical protein n=1 Tax=Pseudomonas umsongensis TaxID=198618 RepID=UPI003ECE0E8C
MLWRLSGACVVRGALFQAIRISAAAFAEINIAVCVEVDVRIWPFWGYVDAMGRTVLLHQDISIKNFSSGNKNP